MKRTKKTTTAIEVPNSLVDEVNLFIKLRLNGEIKGLTQLIEQAKFSPIFDLSDRTDKSIHTEFSTLLIENKACNAYETNVSVIQDLPLFLDTFQPNNVWDADWVKTTAIVDVPLLFLDNPQHFVSEPELLDLSDRTDSNSDEIELTDSQSQAFDDLKDFVYSGDRYFRLTGYAGTGKSFLMIRFIKWLASEKLIFQAACPTNKAAKNLCALASEQGIELEKLTIAQLLNQQPKIDEDTGKERFLSENDPDFTMYNVIIIDEFSMVSKANFDAIVIAVSQSLITKVIFVGDPAQLPPINENEPTVMNSDLITRSSSLTEVVRYDGDLARIAETVRNGQFDYNFKTTSDRTIEVLPETEWLNRAVRLFESEEYRRNPDHVRFLAWRNKTVDQLNAFVRSQLWGKDALPYVPGDRLIARKPCFRPVPGGGKRGKSAWRILINNSEECQVLELGELCELKFLHSQTYRYWKMAVRLESGAIHDLSILDRGSLDDYRNQLKDLCHLKLWNDYYTLSRMFDDVTYSYALTVHKSQGSTIHNVFLDASDILQSSDRQKLVYTAITRAKRQVLIPE